MSGEIAVFSVIGIGLVGAVMAVLLLFYSISGLIMPYLTEEIIGDFSACGGLIQLLNAIRIAGLKDVPVADFLPSLMIVFFFSAFWAQLF